MYIGQASGGGDDPKSSPTLINSAVDAEVSLQSSRAVVDSILRSLRPEKGASEPQTADAGRGDLESVLCRVNILAEKLRVSLTAIRAVVGNPSQPKDQIYDVVRNAKSPSPDAYREFK